MESEYRAGAAALLQISCPDQKGLVAAITRFISDHGGNILTLNEYVDRQQQRFFMRLQWELTGFDVDRDKLHQCLQDEFGTRFTMHFNLRFSDQRQKMALFVSHLGHCFFDLLARWQAGELQVDIPLIISNHEHFCDAAAGYGIPYFHVPVLSNKHDEAEQKQLLLLREHAVDFVVLARYMQILSGTFISEYPNRVINIHHSFLPAFPGARPYHSARERGVKIIGATSHYVTADLDAGPIITQDIAPVSHRDEVEDLKRKGRDLEKTVLAQAVWYHLEHRIIVFNNRTILFD